jgi:mannose/fructose/N-acetylgalactosamine-specific phosphotransferase system component IIB
LPAQVRSTHFTAPNTLPKLLLAQASKSRQLLIFRDIFGVITAMENGLTLKSLNLGNQAYLPQTRCLKLARCFFATKDDLINLDNLANNGLNIYFQSVPGDKPIPYDPFGHAWPE